MCPNTSRFCGRVAKLQKLLSNLESGSCYLFRVRKRDSNFFAASIGLRIETTDFYLIRARKMAQLVGLDRSKQKPYLQRNHSSRDWEGKIRGAIHRQEE
jgi:hypothetical protein